MEFISRILGQLTEREEGANNCDLVKFVHDLPCSPLVLVSGLSIPGVRFLGTENQIGPVRSGA